SMTPANSAPGENGNSGLYWYFPAMIRRSKKLSAAASIRTTACPCAATGSATSPMVRSSGPPARVHSNAFITAGSRFYRDSRRARRVCPPGPCPGCDNSFFPLLILPVISLWSHGDGVRAALYERPNEADTEPAHEEEIRTEPACIAAARRSS